MTALHLHIGTPKTGTTTVQAWFAAHRAALRDHGLWYPRVFGAVNHQRLMLAARGPGPLEAAHHRHGIHAEAEIGPFTEGLLADLDTDLAQHNDATWVISNEHLYSKLKQPEMLARLRDILAPRFNPIRIHLHLRPQVDLVVSNTSQRARLGKEVTRAALTRPAISEASRYFNYDRAVALWEAAFGAETVSLVPFRRTPSMADHLIDVLGLDRDALPPVERRNEALGWRAMALANAVARPLLAEGGGLNHDREIFLNDLPGSEPIRIGSDLAREIQGRFASSNAALIARRADLAPGDLDPDWARYEGAENLSALETPCPFEDQLTDMVTRFNRALRTERAERALAEARAAWAEGAPEAARRHFARAEGIVATLAPDPDRADRLERLRARLSGEEGA